MADVGAAVEQVRVRVLPDGRMTRKDAAKYLGIAVRRRPEARRPDLREGRDQTVVLRRLTNSKQTKRSAATVRKLDVYTTADP